MSLTLDATVAAEPPQKIKGSLERKCSGQPDSDAPGAVGTGAAGWGRLVSKVEDTQRHGPLADGRSRRPDARVSFARSEPI